MVSNARLDFPDPDSPVTTTSRSRGISSETFFRLCTRAPRTAIVVRGPLLAAVSVGIASLFHMNKCQLLNLDIALLGEMCCDRNLADDLLVGKVLARQRDALDAEVPFEMVFDLNAGTRLTGLAQMVDHGTE